MSRIRCLSCKALIIDKDALEGSIYQCALEFPVTFYWTARNIEEVHPLVTRHGCTHPYKTRIAVKHALQNPMKKYRYRHGNA